MDKPLGHFYRDGDWRQLPLMTPQAQAALDAALAWEAAITDASVSTMVAQDLHLIAAVRAYRAAKERP